MIIERGYRNERKDKWIKNFRTRMEGYSEPAPADLWEQLEKELDTVPKVIPMWRRWQAVAAVALLVVVSSLTVWFGSHLLQTIWRNSRQS